MSIKKRISSLEFGYLERNNVISKKVFIQINDWNSWKGMKFDPKSCMILLAYIFIFSLLESMR